MFRRNAPVFLTAIVLLVCAAFATAAVGAGPTATATKVKAKAAQAAKTCKKATARAAKAKSPSKRTKLIKVKKKACKKAEQLATAAVPTISTPAAGKTNTATETSAPVADVTPPAAVDLTPPADNPTSAADNPTPPQDQPDAPGSGFVVGVDANSKVYADPGALMDKITQKTHVQHMREELEWNSVEATKGHYDWSRYDLVYSAAAERGIELLLVVTAPPTWAAPSWNWIPPDPTQYAGFVAKAAARYGPGGTFWTSHPALRDVGTTHFELWNEPYVDYFAANGMDAGRYANLAIAAADAGHAANPRTQYLASTDDQAGNGEDWTRAMFAARPDLARHVDGFAIHPYGPDLNTYKEGPAGSFRRNLEQTTAALDANGAGNKPLWLTEIGWSTCTSGGVCVTEQQQAALTKQLGQLLSTTYSKSVRGLFLFNYSDYDESDSNSEHHYGLVHESGAEKPVAAQVRAIADAQNS